MPNPICLLGIEQLVVPNPSVGTELLSVPNPWIRCRKTQNN